MSSFRSDVAPPERNKMILVATDGSPLSTDAIAFAVELASEHHAEPIFVHLVPTLDLVLTIGVDSIGGAFPHEPTEHDHAVLKDAAAVAAPHAVASHDRPPGRLDRRGDCGLRGILRRDRHRLAQTRRGCQRSPRQRLARRLAPLEPSRADRSRRDRHRRGRTPYLADG